MSAEGGSERKRASALAKAGTARWRGQHCHQGRSSKARPFPFAPSPAKVNPLGWGVRVSRQHINEYRAELDRLRAVSGSRREGVLSDAFKDLLRRWGRAENIQ